MLAMKELLLLIHMMTQGEGLVQGRAHGRTPENEFADCVLALIILPD
jgi:hypothetical protein